MRSLKKTIQFCVVLLAVDTTSGYYLTISVLGEQGAK